MDKALNVKDPLKNMAEIRKMERDLKDRLASRGVLVESPTGQGREPGASGAAHAPTRADSKTPGSVTNEESDADGTGGSEGGSNCGVVFCSCKATLFSVVACTPLDACIAHSASCTPAMHTNHMFVPTHSLPAFM